MKVKLEVSLEHSVMFLSDPYADDIAPLDVENKMVAFNESCAAFKVRSYLEGGASVIISSEAHLEARKPDFRTSINVRSRIISVSDSGRFNYCMLPVDGYQANIEIWNLPDESVWIRVDPLIEY